MSLSTRALALLRHCVLLLLLVLSGLLHGYRLEEKSPTEDEWAHLVRGMQYLSGEDTRLQYAHPPLANALVALPVADDESGTQFEQLPGWAEANLGEVSLGFLQRDYAGARGKLMRARRAQLLILWAGILYAYTWGYSIINWTTGATLSLLVASSPVLLGHSRYIGTDVGCAVSFLVVTGECARLQQIRGGTLLAWILLPTVLAVAVLTKHSGLLLLPIVSAALLRWHWTKTKRSRLQRLGLWALHNFFLLLILTLAVNIAYRFQDSGLRVDTILALPEPQYWVSARFEHRMLEEESPIAYLPAATRVPLPRTWIFGVTAVGVQAQQGYPWASFFGLPTPDGHPGYFPLLSVLKTPWPVLMLGTGLALDWRRHRATLAALWPIGVTLCLYLLVASASTLNMGIRHGLPIIILVLPYAAVAGGGLVERCSSGCSRAVVALLMAAVLAAPALKHVDDYLGYFNIGATLGHQVSVVGEDMGQDRYGFAQEVSSRQLGPILYDSQTRVRAMEARYSGLRFLELDCATKIPPGMHAAVHITRAHHIGPRCMPQLQNLQPSFVFNHRIVVFRAPKKKKRSRRGLTRD